MRLLVLLIIAPLCLSESPPLSKEQLEFENNMKTMEKDRTLLEEYLDGLKEYPTEDMIKMKEMKKVEDMNPEELSAYNMKVRTYHIYVKEALKYLARQDTKWNEVIGELEMRNYQLEERVRYFENEMKDNRNRPDRRGENTYYGPVERESYGDYSYGKERGYGDYSYGEEGGYGNGRGGNGYDMERPYGGGNMMKKMKKMMMMRGERQQGGGEHGGGYKKRPSSQGAQGTSVNNVINLGNTMKGAETTTTNAFTMMGGAPPGMGMIGDMMGGGPPGTQNMDGDKGHMDGDNEQGHSIEDHEDFEQWINEFISGHDFYHDEYLHKQSDEDNVSTDAPVEMDEVDEDES